MTKLVVVLNTLINPLNAGGSESSAMSVLSNFRDRGPAEIDMLVTALPRFVELMQGIRGKAEKVITWPWAEFSPVSSEPKTKWAKQIRARLGPGWLGKRFEDCARLVNERAFIRAMPTADDIDAFLDRYKADVVHFTYSIKWPTRRPFIFEPHDIQHVHFPEFFSRDALHWRAIAFPDGIRNSAFVVCGTWWTKRDIMKHYDVPASQVAVVPRSSTTARIELDPKREAEIIAEAKLPAVFAYYPAMTFPHKNHLRLFEAMALLRDRKKVTISLVCTGRPHKPFHPTLVEAVKTYKLENQVKFLGRVSEELLTACYRRARYIAFPSLFEGHSQSLLESLFHRKPIIAAMQSSIPETIGEAGLLFDGLDVEAIAAALERAWVDDVLIAGLVAKTDGAFERYGWDRAIVTLTACYKQAAGWTLNANERAALDQALLERAPAYTLGLRN